ncbi:SDR family oxidoreductase [Helicobacter sp. 13S00482-2]|uniref:SDR family oxidoreductase n=1 Tax=Helicobacter sp. 13S00482-2 TaxID=1476200 RepID=UPI000BA76C8F|nr:SDR family oxidoreductase [Helicobacter sp. 13S00482-2]
MEYQRFYFFYAEWGGGIKNFIHCGGKAEFSPIRYFNYAESIENFNVNFFSCCEIISTLLKKPNKPHLENIILISSISGIRGYKGSSIYGASKACLDSITRSLCDELSPQIKINSIVLGNINTKSTMHLESLKPSPIGEGKSEDVGNLVDFLLKSGYLNGQNIVLDGGRSTIGN